MNKDAKRYSEWQKIRKEKVMSSWSHNPRCSICGVITILPTGKDKGMQFDNTATFGHLFPRSDIRRLLDDRSWQLECYKCNHTKGVSENLNPAYYGLYGKGAWLGGDSYPELLIALAEDKDNEIYLVQNNLK